MPAPGSPHASDTKHPKGPAANQPHFLPAATGHLIAQHLSMLGRHVVSHVRAPLGCQSNTRRKLISISRVIQPHPRYFRFSGEARTVTLGYPPEFRRLKMLNKRSWDDAKAFPRTENKPEVVLDGYSQKNIVSMLNLHSVPPALVWLTCPILHFHHLYLPGFPPPRGLGYSDT